MQMTETIWRVAAPYDGSSLTHRQSQEYFLKAARDLGIGWDKMKWSSGLTIPKNALIYDEQNPSPGYRIDLQYWDFNDEDSAMIFHLACGNHVEKLSREVKP